MAIFRWWWFGVWYGLTGPRPPGETFAQGLRRVGRFYMLVLLPFVIVVTVMFVTDAIWRMFQ